MISPLDKFIAPHEGAPNNLTAHERELAATVFYTLVDDVLLTYADKVEVSDYTTIPNTSGLALQLVLSDGASLHIGVRTKELTLGSLLHERQIVVSEFNGEGIFQRRYEYDFKPDTSEVTRSDFLKKSSEEAALKDENYWEREAERVHAMSSEEFAAAASDVVKQMHANAELDRQMGFNHQPVGPVEIEALRDLVSSSRPED